MEITGIRVRNFRTIGTTDAFLDLRGPMTLVGPNNSGKTNILRALETLFTGHENVRKYDVHLDSPHGSMSVRTSLVGYFEGDDQDPSSPDASIYQSIDKLFELYGLDRPSSSIALYLNFSPSGTPVYSFFPNQKRPGDSGKQASISRIQRSLVTDLLEKFECHYIPSATSVSQLFSEVLVPFMKAAVVRVLEPQLASVNAELATVATTVSKSLKAAGIDDLTASFEFEGGSIENALSGFDFYLEDPYRTRLDRKGQGIQSAAFMATLLWVTNEESSRDKQSIWLFEEPESYLHPGLASVALTLLSKLSEAATVLMTTHSMAFVPQDPKRVLGTSLESGATLVTSFTSHLKATESIRRGLGVSFSDYFSLGKCTVFVEGQTDAQILRWFLELSEGEAECEWEMLRSASISDRGGASELAGFIRANYSLIRVERATVSLFDGDDAGLRAINGLQAYFSAMGETFVSNRDYVITRNGLSIEGLFPDDWVKDLYAAHPSWFKSFIEDAQGTLASFSTSDAGKQPAVNNLISLANSAPFSDWSARLMAVCDALDKSLRFQQTQIDA